MGAGLVKLCYEHWTHLEDAPFRVLVFMAVTAMDDDPDPIFYRGRVALASAMGLVLVDPDLSGEDAARHTRNVYRAVGRAMTSLTVAKVVEVSRKPGPGHSAEYRLNLSMDRMTVSVPRTESTQDGERPPLDPDSRGDVDGSQDAEWYQRRTLGGTTQDAQRPMEEDRSFLGELPQPLNPRSDLTVPRTRPAEDPNLGGGPASRITLRVVPGTGPPPSPHVVTQPALWPVAVPKEADVEAEQARQIARDAVSAARRSPRAAKARQTASGDPGPVPDPVPAADGPACTSCSTLLDPDGTCFTCHDGRVQTA